MGRYACPVHEYKTPLPAPLAKICAECVAAHCKRVMRSDEKTMKEAALLADDVAQCIGLWVRKKAKEEKK